MLVPETKEKNVSVRQALHSGLSVQVVKDDESDLLVPVFPENEREGNAGPLKEKRYEKRRSGI